MYKDIITELKIPEIYILLNGKNYKVYYYLFQSIIDIRTSKRQYYLKIKTIITDS